MSHAVALAKAEQRPALSGAEGWGHHVAAVRSPDPCFYASSEVAHEERGGVEAIIDAGMLH